MDFSGLQLVYQAVLFEQRTTAVLAKLAFLGVWLAVFLGNQKPGHRLLTTVLGVLLVVSGFLVLGGRDHPNLGGRSYPIAGLPGTTALLAGLVCLVSAIRPDGQWRLADGGWRTAAGLALVAWALVYPIHWRFYASGDEGIARAILHSPMGVLPQPMLLAGVGAVLASGSRAPLFAAIALCGGAVVVGLGDALAGGIPSSWVLVLAGGVALFFALKDRLPTAAAQEDAKEGGPAVEWRRKSTVLPEDEVLGDGKPRPAPKPKAAAPPQAKPKPPAPSPPKDGGRWKLK